ncbi:MAG: PAS domain-containing protein [Methanoregulaceae archaeon]
MMDNYQDELSRIKALLKKNPEGMSVTEIAKALDKNKNTVGRYLDILLISGHVMVRNYGMAKVFTLSQRVPLSAMLSYSNELIMVLDKDQRVVEINDQFLSFLGCARADVVGKNSAFLTSPTIDLHEIRKAIAQKGNKTSLQITIPPTNAPARTFRVKNIATVFDDGTQGVTIILEDITEQVQAEEALKASEERFRLMAEHIQDVLIIIENGKLIFANNRLTEMSGYSLKELERMGQYNIIAPESRKEIDDLTRQIETGENTLGEIRIWILCKDKSRKFMYGRMTSYLHEGRHYIYLIMTDLTKEKQAENTVRESEQRFRLMAENLQEGILIIENEKIVYANHSIAEMTGYPLEEIPELHTVNVVSPEDFIRMGEIAHRVEVREIPSAELNFWITRKDGDRRYLTSRVTASHHEDVRSIYITATDITASRKKENTQQSQIRCLQRVIDTLPHAMYTRDAAGKILTVNSRFGEIIGRNPDDLPGKNLADVVDPELFGTLVKGDEEILAQSPEHYRYEGTIRGADGVPFSVIIRKEIFLNLVGKTGGILVGIYPQEELNVPEPALMAAPFPETGRPGSQDQTRKSVKKPPIRKSSRIQRKII